MHEAKVITDEKDILNTLRNKGFNPKEVIIMMEENLPGTIVEALNVAPKRSGSRVTATDYGANYVEMGWRWVALDSWLSATPISPVGTGSGWQDPKEIQSRLFAASCLSDPRSPRAQIRL